MIPAALVSSNPIVGVVVAIVLIALGRTVAQKVTAAEQNPWLLKVLTWSLVLHLLAAPAQILVVQHVYHNISDWNRYTHQGASMASNLHHFNFTTSGTGIGKIVNDGSVSYATGIIMAIVGPDDVSAFLVFAWFAWLGGVLYYRAFTLTFSNAGFRRYGLLVFFLPSILFWTGDSSKESIMFFVLSLGAYGAARIFRGLKGGYVLIVPSVVLGALIRPNELLLLMGGFAVAMTVRVATASNASAMRRVFGFGFGIIVFVVSLNVTQHYLTHNGSLTGQLQATNASNSLSAGGVGSGGVPYSSDPLTYPRDIYEMFFNPLPINFHGSSELIAAGENTILLVLVFYSIRQLRMIPRTMFSRPYVMMCLIYSVGFVYAFSALGNLGLIERERTMLLPFLLVLLCIPRGRKKAPPRYEWELRRKDRRRLQPLLERTGGFLPVPLWAREPAAGSSRFGRSGRRPVR